MGCGFDARQCEVKEEREGKKRKQCKEREQCAIARYYYVARFQSAGCGMDVSNDT